MTKRVGEQPGKHSSPPSSTPAVTRVTHRAGDRTFFAFADPGLLQKYRTDPSTPLVDVVQSFQVYEESGGAKPSKQTLSACFNTTDEVEVLQTILREGDVKGLADTEGRGGAYSSY